MKASDILTFVAHAQRLHQPLVEKHLDQAMGSEKGGPVGVGVPPPGPYLAALLREESQI